MFNHLIVQVILEIASWEDVNHPTMEFKEFWISTNRKVYLQVVYKETGALTASVQNTKPLSNKHHIGNDNKVYYMCAIVFWTKLTLVVMGRILGAPEDLKGYYLKIFHDGVIKCWHLVINYMLTCSFEIWCDSHIFSFSYSIR